MVRKRCGIMEIVITAASLVFAAAPAFGQCPDGEWMQYQDPAEAGWSLEKLEQARQYYDEIGSAALMVVYDGKVLIAWGDIERRFLCHSIRKSFLSALYGIGVKEGKIDIQKTLAELSIDDEPKLTENERKATIEDLLTCRSGIYHDAAAENDDMLKDRPARGSHQPGVNWWYNNWSFNALGTIFEKETGTRIFEEFRKRIADPIGMEDFELSHTWWQEEPDRSNHAAYKFRMSARDMARFGLLYLRKGKWNGVEVIPEQWVEQSTSSQVRLDGFYNGYGYMWWVSNSGPFRQNRMYSALGIGQNSIDVLTGDNLVYVHRVNTFETKRVSMDQRLLRLSKMILEAKVREAVKNPRLILLPRSKTQIDQIELDQSVLAGYAGDYVFDEFTIEVKLKDTFLVFRHPEGILFRLLPLSKSQFIVEDVEEIMQFDLDSQGNPQRMTFELAGKRFEGRKRNGN
jgi:CubicO group peptidase (beta-lactamase class C family)